MSKIDSDALGPVKKQLNSTGADPDTEMASGDLKQVFDVTSAVRRGRSSKLAGGWWVICLEARHTAAETVVVQIDPYAGVVLKSSETGPSWPFPIDPEKFDIIIHEAYGHRISGGGVVFCSLGPAIAASSPLVGVKRFEDVIPINGVIVTPQPFVVWAMWNDSVSAPRPVDGVTTGFFTNSLNDVIAQPIGVRLPPGAMLSFASTSDAAAVNACTILVSVQPAGMGSDVSGYGP